MKKPTSGAVREISKEQAANMALAASETPARCRLVFRLRGYLGGWYVVAEGVGDVAHYRETVDLIKSMIRDEGDNPDEYEFRVDTAPPVAWTEGRVVPLECAP